MRKAQLKNVLEELYAGRSRERLASDPLSFCHRYNDPADREIAAVVASSLAYGKVGIILGNLERIFALMGPSPREFVARFEPRQGMRELSSFKHRFNDGRDVTALFLALRTMLEEADGVGEFFLGCYDPKATDLTASLVRYTESVLSFDYTPVFGRGPLPQTFRYLFPSPAGGSACKRLCMLLRWMVRPADGIDLGLWKGVDPAKLLIPVDTHIHRISRCLGFTRRATADWKTAVEITAALRRFDPADPVKYDFSLCHLGIAKECDPRDPSLCAGCVLRPGTRGAA